MSIIGLEGTPYLLDEKSEAALVEQIEKLEERVRLLRRSGVLTDETARQYYGEKRFEQVAESNAIEGSTLSVGETEAAIMKGITITGHDPAYVRDARSLDKALLRLMELAKENRKPTDIGQLHELHGLILGERPGSGRFRDEPVRISGSDHTPPKRWPEIMANMEQWEKWSGDNITLPTPIRAAVLHAWLAHIHPFVDGNGRCARAVSNLELVRAGYPPIIVKKKERERYIEALRESDCGGDIRAFMELILGKIEGALTGLELSARKAQGYSPIQEKIRQRQEQQLGIWLTSVELLARSIERVVYDEIESVGGKVFVKLFESALDMDDYISLCERRAVSQSWAFIVHIQIPGLRKRSWLAYMGYRSATMFHALGDEGGPSIFWSRKNAQGYPQWVSVESEAPFCIESTTQQGAGDEWYVRTTNGDPRKMTTTELARRIARSLVEAAADE